MGLSVQMHPDKYDVILFPATADDKDAFATVKAFEDKGTVTLFLKDAAACDQLITAAVEAKRLLLDQPLPHEPIAPRCESTNLGLTIPGEQVRQCTLEQGHPGQHVAAKEGGVVTGTWDDEPDPPHNCPATAEIHTPEGVAVLYCTRATGHDGDHWDGPVNFPADDEPIDIPPRPARAPESRCGALHPGPAILAKCNSQNGHDGPDHITWDGDGLEISRWAVTVTAPSGGVMFGPFSPEAAEAVTPAVEDSMAPPPHPVVHADGSYSFPGELSAATLYEAGSDDAETAASRA